MWDNAIIYEQPVNEHTRVCLRLERLFQQIDYTASKDSVWDNRATVSALLETLNVLDRPDLKTKLVKELVRMQGHFAKLEATGQHDKKKIAQIIKPLETVSKKLQALHGKFAQALREHELLNNIRQYSLNPGGACAFEIPAYHFWLQQSADKRQRDIHGWLEHLEIIKDTVYLMLRLVRDSGEPQIRVAERGFYQTMLDPLVPCQLIQVTIPRQYEFYPEVSVSRHGVFTRFFAPKFTDRAVQVVQDVTFKIACCIL